MKKQNLFVVVLALVQVMVVSAFAYGEDKLGPHNGFIRMPGPFLTEVLTADKNTVTVYLLDIQQKNPVVAKSSVKVSLLQDKKTITAICAPTDFLFLCEFPASVNLKLGQLIVDAERDGQKGIPAEYNLPLAITKPKPAEPELLLEKSVIVKPKTYRVIVERRPSRPEAMGQGECGAGYETELKIFLKKDKPPVFKKLIQSCLEDILLNGNDDPEDSKTFLENSLTFLDNRIEIHWLSIKNKSHIKGIVDMKNRDILFSEENDPK